MEIKRKDTIKTIDNDIRNELLLESDQQRKRREQLEKVRIQFDGKEYWYEENENEIKRKPLQRRQLQKLQLNEVVIEILYISINKMNWKEDANGKKTVQVHEFVGKVIQKNMAIHSVHVNDYVIGTDKSQHCFKSFLITSIDNIRKIEYQNETQLMNIMANMNSGTIALSMIQQVMNGTCGCIRDDQTHMNVLVFGDGVIVRKFCDLLRSFNISYWLVINDELNCKYLHYGYNVVNLLELTTLMSSNHFDVVVDFYNMKPELEKIHYNYYFTLESTDFSNETYFNYQSVIQAIFKSFIQPHIHALINIHNESDLSKLPSLIQELDTEDQTIIISFQ